MINDINDLIGLAWLYVMWLLFVAVAFGIVSYFLNIHIKNKHSKQIISILRNSSPDLMRQISYILSKNLYLTPHKCGDNSKIASLIFDIYRSFDFNKQKDGLKLKYYLKRVNKHFKFSVHKFKIFDHYNKIKQEMRKDTSKTSYFAKKNQIATVESSTITQLVDSKLSCIPSFSGWDLKIKKILKNRDQIFPQNCKYIIDAISSAEAIVRLLILSKYARLIIEQNGEFYKLISNAITELQNTDLIVEKTYPIYLKFYNLGNVSKSKPDKFSKILDNKTSYTIFINYIKSLKNFSVYVKPELTNQKEEKPAAYHIFQSRTRTFRDEILAYIDELVQSDKSINLSVKKVVNKILIKGLSLCDISNIRNFKALIWVLTHLDEVLKHYESQMESDAQSKLRDKYLNGDFNSEKDSLIQEFNLKNIENGHHFEVFLENLFRRLGYKVHSTPITGDQGADLLLKKDNKTYVVQAKFYSNNLGNTPIQEVVGALKYYNGNQGVVITNSEFTKGAYDLAKANNVILIDGERLRSLIEHIFDPDAHEEDLLDLKFGCK